MLRACAHMRRWESPATPDIEGEQLKAMKEYLAAHEHIEYIW